MVGIRRLFARDLICQQEIRVGGILVRITSIGETYCFLTFPSVGEMNTCLASNALEKWFLDLKSWEDSNLAYGSLPLRLFKRGDHLIMA